MGAVSARSGTTAGNRFGLLISLVGIACALLNFSVGYRVTSTLSAGVCWSVISHVIPLARFALAGVLARRRGRAPFFAGLVSGIVCGALSGLATFAVFAATPNKPALVKALWAAHVKLGSKPSADNHQALVGGVLHPSLSANVVNNVMTMALLGAIFALLGGMGGRSACQGGVTHATSRGPRSRGSPGWMKARRASLKLPPTLSPWRQQL